MGRNKSPRDIQMAYLSFDGGSYSIKYASDDKSGSFLSLTAQAPRDALGAFSALTDHESYNLNILQAGKATGRWVVGKQAVGRENVKRYTRNIQRFNDTIFSVFMCGALRGAFPDRGRPLKDLEENRGIVDGRWRIPVKVATSIAPGYYSNASLLAEAAKGYYDFVDLQTGRLYCFTLEKSTVMPEGWGIYASRLYNFNQKTGAITKKKAKRFIDSSVAVFDAGGRTTDIMVWRGGRPLENQIMSADVGIILSAEAMIKDIVSIHNNAFPNMPDVLDVIAAIEKRRNGHVFMIGAGGHQVDVSEIVDRHMREYADRTFELYQNVLRGGMNLEAMLYGGGGSVIAKPYMEANNVLHAKEYMAARNTVGMYMANALYSYAYMKHRDLGDVNV